LGNIGQVIPLIVKQRTARRSQVSAVLYFGRPNLHALHV
jgi:hypothetical protein